MLTALQVYKMARDYGSTATLAQATTALNSVDRTPYEQEQQARYRIEVWDKQSLINGISPEVIMERVPEGGEVYMIYVDGNLTFLQPHDPDQAGFAAMDATVAAAKAQAQIDRMVELEVDRIVMDECLVQLL